MGISKSFNGNIVDRNGDPIDCRYKGYHVEQDKWSDWRDSDSQYYSIDLSDEDWLGNDGSTGDTDHIVIVFETYEDEATDREFVEYFFQMDGSDTYDVDVQLKPCLEPMVNNNWNPRSPTDGTTTFKNSDDDDTITYIGRINEEITVDERYSDEKTWVYNDVTMSHFINVHSHDIFGDRLGIDTVQYDWDESDEFVDDKKHKYTEISQTDGDKSQEIECSVTNKKGLNVKDILKIQIRYNYPIADILWDPIKPSINDTFKPKGNNQDIDSRITGISYQYDGVEVDKNTDLEYEWTQDLGDVYDPDGHTLNSDIEWNDGFNDLKIVHQEHFNMTNLSPVFDLTKEVIGDEEDNDIKFHLSGLEDPDGDDDKLEARWVIEYKTPIDNKWVTVLNSGYPDDPDLDPKEWVFEVGGSYKVSAIVKDQYELETTKTLELTFESGANCEASGKIRLNARDGGTRWQQIAIPVKNKKVKEYFLDWIDDKIKEYDDSKGVEDVVERVTAYPGNLGKTLTFVPGSTPESAKGNFDLVMEDGTNIFEITGFYAVIKDYKDITDGEDLVFEWNMGD